jgi:hypothetical protein
VPDDAPSVQGVLANTRAADWDTARVLTRRLRLGRVEALVRFSFVVLSVPLLSACGATSGSNGQPTGSLAATLRGASQRIVINESSGRMGTIRLGQSVTSVKHLLPSRYLFNTGTDGDDLLYCSHRKGDTCTGVTLQVFDRCAFQTLCEGKSGHQAIARIDLTAGTADSAWLAAQTLRGIHLFSPTRLVLARYRIADTGPGICGGMPSPSSSYVALAGQNSIVLTTYRRKVRVISLRSGFRPVCESQG